MKDDKNNNTTNVAIPEEESSDAQMDAENQKYEDAIKEIEDDRKEREARKKEIMDRIRKERNQFKKKDDNGGEEQKTRDGRIVGGGAKKVYSHSETKVFRHNKLNDFSTGGIKKMEKTLHKVHGVDIKKKVAFLKAIEAYNTSKTTLTRKDFDKFARSFKGKNYSGKNYKNIKEAGIDIKGMRKDFSKRDIDQLRRGITGDENKYAYKSKASDMKKSSPSPSTGNTRSR
ncbi:hypothetical protein K0B03_02715 [Patescibacteria group bacterium]|nr:hypothetical protein [Patescibacteria group bacterium]